MASKLRILGRIFSGEINQTILFTVLPQSESIWTAPHSNKNSWEEANSKVQRVTLMISFHSASVLIESGLSRDHLEHNQTFYFGTLIRWRLREGPNSVGILEQYQPSGFRKMANTFSVVTNTMTQMSIVSMLRR